MKEKEINEFLSHLTDKVEWTKEELKVLAELGYNKPLLDKMFNKVLNSLKNSMLKDELTSEYVRGAKASILGFKSFFKED